MQAFILAGGFATRLWPLTEKRAKPLLPLAGVPLIEHLTANIPAHIPIVISTNAVFQEDFEAWRDSIDRKNVEILIEDAKNDDHKLGALGATAQWITKENVHDDILLLTGDNYCGFSIDAFISAASSDTTLIAVHDIGDLETATSFGTVLTEGEGTVRSVVGFEEKPSAPKTTLVNTGCSLLPASILPILVEHAKEHPDNVGGIFEELLKRHKAIECFSFKEPWFDIGSFDAYLEATKELVGTDVREEGSTVEDSTLQGSIVMGARSTVSKSTLHNVVLFEDCVIEDCVLQDCIIDQGCTLHGIDLTGKMLRAGTTLKTNPPF